MRALVQRVSSARVDVDGKTIGEIGGGLLILVCAMDGDGTGEATKLADKITKLRIFRDEDGRMNQSLQDVGGEALVVSQFTLAADTSRGNRPGFSAAARPEIGEPLVQEFAAMIEAKGVRVAHGRFGADMDVSLVNDGPVTIWIDTEVK